MDKHMVLTAILTLVLAGTVTAQQLPEVIAPAAVAEGAAHETSAVRLSDEPQEQFAKSLLITEAAALFPVAGKAEGNSDVGMMFGSELGWMQRLGSRDALALSAFGFVGVNDPRAGMKLHYRRWLARPFSLDFGLGTVLWDAKLYRRNEFVGSLGLSWNDRLQFTLHYENYRSAVMRWISTQTGGYVTSSSHRESGLYAGLKVGRGPGLLAVSAATVAILIFLSTFEMGPIM